MGDLLSRSHFQKVYSSQEKACCTSYLLQRLKRLLRDCISGLWKLNRVQLVPHHQRRVPGRTVLPDKPDFTLASVAQSYCCICRSSHHSFFQFRFTRVSHSCVPTLIIFYVCKSGWTLRFPQGNPHFPLHCPKCKGEISPFLFHYIETEAKRRKFQKHKHFLKSSVQIHFLFPRIITLNFS